MGAPKGPNWGPKIVKVAQNGPNMWLQMRSGAPFETLQILETPRDQLWSNFGVPMGAPKGPNRGPKIVKLAQNGANM